MGAIRADLRIGVRIGLATVKDRFRRHTSSRREKALFGLIALIAVPWFVLFLQQTYAIGVGSRGGVDAPVVAIARNLLVPSLLVLSVIAGLESVQQLGSDSVRSLLLTTASTRSIVIGKVFSLLVSWLLLVLMGFAFIVAYSAGARSPLFPVAVVLAAIPLFVLVLLFGLSLGYSLWLGVERLGLSDGLRQLLTAVLYIAIMIGIFAMGSLVGGQTAQGGLASILPTGDPVVPLGWDADLFFLGSPMETSIGVQTLLAAAFVLGAVPASFALVVRLAPLYWYASPTETTDDSDGEESVTVDATPSERIGRTAGTLSGRSPTLRMMRSYLRSARRQPDQFVYLFYYLFPVAPVLVQQALSAPESFSLTLGASLVLLGGWFAGGLFCLNPLGSEGTMLSQIVLAKRPAQAFVHARLFLGGALGISFAVAGIGLFAVSHSQIPLLTAGVGLLFASAAIVASAGVALGLGSVLPKFEAVEIFESVETVAPSLVAALIHGVVTVLFLLGAVGVTLAVTLPESPLSVPQKLGAVAGFVVLAGIVTDGSRRYAIARLRDYGRETTRTDRPFALYFSLGLAFFAFLLGQMIALTAVFFIGVDLSLEALVPILFVIEYLGYVIVGVGFLYVTHRGVSYLDISWPTGREVAFVFGGLLASLVIWGVASLVITGLGLPAADHALFDAEEDGSPTLLLVLIPLLLFVNGPVEEFLYRNIIQKYLTERFRQATAISMTSVIFALAHVPAYLTAGIGAVSVTLVLLFVLSVFWGVIYAITESLVVVSAIHGLYNGILVFGLYLAIA